MALQPTKRRGVQRVQQATYKYKGVLIYNVKPLVIIGNHRHDQPPILLPAARSARSRDLGHSADVIWCARDSPELSWVAINRSAAEKF
jgi:hypothetical protein